MDELLSMFYSFYGETEDYIDKKSTRHQRKQQENWWIKTKQQQKHTNAIVALYDWEFWMKGEKKKLQNILCIGSNGKVCSRISQCIGKRKEALSLVLIELIFPTVRNLFSIIWMLYVTLFRRRKNSSRNNNTNDGWWQNTKQNKKQIIKLKSRRAEEKNCALVVKKQFYFIILILFSYCYATNDILNSFLCLCAFAVRFNFFSFFSFFFFLLLLFLLFLFRILLLSCCFAWKINCWMHGSYVHFWNCAQN